MERQQCLEAVDRLPGTQAARLACVVQHRATPSEAAAPASRALVSQGASITYKCSQMFTNVRRPMGARLMGGNVEEVPLHAPRLRLD